MKSDYVAAGLLVGAVAIGLGAKSIRSGDEYCPAPSAASVATLFAPCQAFEMAMGGPVTRQQAVRLGLLIPDRQPAPAGTQVASEY
jgi:hypothetical protein